MVDPQQRLLLEAGALLLAAAPAAAKGALLAAAAADGGGGDDAAWRAATGVFVGVSAPDYADLKKALTPIGVYSATGALFVFVRLALVVWPAKGGGGRERLHLYALHANTP